MSQKAVVAVNRRQGFKLLAGERKKCGVLYEVKSTPLLQVPDVKDDKYTPKRR